MGARSDCYGFVGIGTMGMPMAEHIIDAGISLVVRDTNPQVVGELTAAGAAAAGSLDEVGRKCQVVFLSLPGPADVEAVLVGASGLLGSMIEGDVIVDLSTNSHEMVVNLAAAAAEKGVHFLDAPVSGGAVGVRKKTLAVMVGGDAAALDLARPVLDLFAPHIFHVGATGMGTIAKLANNLIVLASTVTVQEAFVMASKAGLDATTLMRIIKKSSAAPCTGHGHFVLSRRFDNPIFKLGIAKKDLAVAVQSAKALGVPMPTTEAALAVYDQAIDMGLGDEVFYATQKALEADAGAEVAVPEKESGG